MTTRQPWCTVQLYNPAVVCHGGKYRMWYLGNATATRTDDLDLGYAESEDGITWAEHPENPILTGDDLPWGNAWQTPYVIFDPERSMFRMWFVMADSGRDSNNALLWFGQKLGYAESPDGLRWEIHPGPLYPTARGPCVIKEGLSTYRMWMNSSPDPDGDFGSLTAHIYRFESDDGIHWIRDPEPAVTAANPVQSVVYPFILKSGDDYTMWYGCHVEGGLFEIFCSTSSDGRTWTHHWDHPTFPATRDPSDFDGRYTSTPCIVDGGDRLLMYYSTRDFGNLYGAGDRTLRVDRMGIYRHIGVAVCPKSR